MRKGFIAVFLVLGFYAQTQIPEGYYNLANGLGGEALKAALHDIIDDHNEYPYTDSGTDVWDILKETDSDPNNSANVICVYSGFSRNAAAEYDNRSGQSSEHITGLNFFL